MKCVKCGAEVTEEQMEARRQELDKMGVIARIVAMCEECRKNAWSTTPIIKKVSR